MKRFFPVFLLAVLIFALAVPACADIAFEPNDNFYKRHRDDCKYENRSYYTSGAEGYVLVYSSPTGSATDAVANGSCFYISYTYSCEWGCIGTDGGKFGWVKMADMVPDYDYIAFAADHEGEFVKKEASLRIGSKDTVYCYKYPGSGIVTDELAGGWARGTLQFSSVFTDPDGREWGYLAYYMAHRNVWICLDVPFNNALEPDENFVEVVTVPAASAEVTEAALRSAKAPTAYITAGAIGVVVIAAAVLLVVIKKKKQS